jgi:hypothetical protein
MDLGTRRIWFCNETEVMLAHIHNMLSRLIKGISFFLFFANIHLSVSIAQDSYAPFNPKNSGRLSSSCLSLLSYLTPINFYDWQPPTDSLFPHVPTQVHWRTMQSGARRTRKYLPLSRVKLRILSWLELEKISNRQIMATWNPQIVRANSPSDNRMLLESNFDGDPHEVVEVVVVAERGKEKSSVLHGSTFQLNGLRGLYKGVLEKVSTSDIGRVSEIEISHVHPIYDWRIVDERAPVEFHYQLSHVDFDAARAISYQYDGVLVKMRAITPNGYSFESSFKNGLQIETEFNVLKN